LVAELQRRFGDAIRSTIHEGDRGVFDVVVDDTLVFSKHRRGRFPTDHEIIAEVEARLP